VSASLLLSCEWSKTFGLRVWKAATSKALARLDIEVSAGWVSPSSRGVMGGAMLCLLNVAAFHSQVRPQTLDVHINYIT
jgi:hypothetical protein